jgi:predicted DNA-binding protein (MmcQ/YjbR family)
VNRRPKASEAQPLKAMTLDDLNALCGGSHVWKVGGATGKMFVICSFADEGGLQVTFKCSAFSYDLLKTLAGLGPAPYLASRGMTWIQRTSDTSMSDAALADYLRESHRLAALNLPKWQQHVLGLIPSPDAAEAVSPRRRSTRT